MRDEVVEALPTGASTTTGGAGRFRRRRPRVVVIAPDASAARRYLARRAPTAGEVLVVTGQDGLAGLDGRRLRRRGRVEWLQGWSEGAGGRERAIAVERAAAVGHFGSARHAFAVDA